MDTTRLPVTDDRLTITGERLTIADLARELHPRMNRSLIQRYDANEDLRRLLGKDDRSYPAESLRFWQMIAEAREQNPPLVKPETAGVFLQALMERERSGESITGNRTAIIPVKPPSQIEALVTTLIALPDALTQRVIAEIDRRVAPPDDRLLTLRQAHDTYGVSYRTLRGLMVKEGSRSKVRQSDVLRLIQSLGK